MRKLSIILLPLCLLYMMNVYADESASEPFSQAEQVGWSNEIQNIMFSALGQIGIQYQYGGNSPETGFDCSGFVRYVFGQAVSLSLPHGAKALSQLGQSVSKQDLKPGDLVFFNTLKSAFSHVGIYLGNNKFIHAPSSGGGVRVERMDSSYWQNRYNGAQRMQTSSTDNPPSTLDEASFFGVEPQ
jgi:cell wall-associated NlpC family hydrolase